MNRAQRSKTFLLSVLTAFVAAGCASQSLSLPQLGTQKGSDVPSGQAYQTNIGQPISTGQKSAVIPNISAVPQVVAPRTTKISATGQGAVTYSDQNTDGQRQLMAQRAARVDAFRSLAEVVYGFKISGQTSVSSFATRNDNVRSYVDSFIRGARIVNMSALPNGIYEATVEIELNNDFYYAVTGCVSTGCAQPLTGCVESGCTPSVASCAGISCAQPQTTANSCVGQGCAQPSAFSFTSP